MEVNFFGVVNYTEVMLDQIRTNKGVIVNISSVAGFAPLLGRTAYAASKRFFESLEAELQDEGGTLSNSLSLVHPSAKRYS